MIITVNESKEAPPEGTPMYYMTTNANLHMCIWLKQWNKITMNEESLQFSPHGTFTWKIIESLRRVLYEMKPPPRPAQYEALETWEHAVHAKEKSQIRAKKTVCCWMKA